MPKNMQVQKYANEVLYGRTTKMPEDKMDVQRYASYAHQGRFSSVGGELGDGTGGDGTKYALLERRQLYMKCIEYNGRDENRVEKPKAHWG